MERSSLIGRMAPRARLLLGLDRSVERTSQAAVDRPWRPWTLPNALTFLRLAAIPAFLVLAFGEDRGRGAASITLFAVIGWGDFADGALARATGQYSRLGALLDPITDRLLALAGAWVCWRYDLLPRWALALLMAREAFMLLLGRYALAHHIELRINRLGRAAIIPVMGSLFFAMIAPGAFPEALLCTGLFLAFAASARYVASGRAQLAERQPAGS